MTKPWRYVAALIVATIFYGAFGVLSRLLADDFGTFGLIGVRNALQLPILLLVFWRFPKLWSSLRRESFWWYLSWILLGVIVLGLAIVAWNEIEIGLTYFMFYAGLTISGVVVGHSMFGERLSKAKVVALGLTLVGIVIMFDLRLESSALFYQMLAMVAGLLSGLWYGIGKKLAGWYSEGQMLVLDSIGTAVVGLGLMLAWRESIPSIAATQVWGTIGLFSLCYLVAAGGAFYGFKHLEAQRASLIMPLEVFFGALFAWVIFNETLTVRTWIGGALILAAVVGMSVGSEKLKFRSS